MLNKLALLPDDKDRLRFVAALSRLKAREDFTQYVELLKQAQYAIDRKIRTAQPPELQWDQGAAQFLSDLLALIEQSESLHELLRKQVESKGTPHNGF